MELKELRKINIEETKEKIEHPSKEFLLVKALHFYEEIERSLRNICASDTGMKEAALTVVESLKKAKADAEKQIRSLAVEIAPKTVEIVGEVLTARLISLASGMEKLSRMASSKIQLLGAEKAFFKHLKDGCKAPKHGVIFMHESVRKAENTGKAARKLANEIAKAVRIDFYSKKE